MMKHPDRHVSQQGYIPPYFLDKNRLSKIKTLLPIVEKTYQEYAEKNHFPGYVFGVMVDGKLIHSGGGGYINLKEKIPATKQSMFRIASMTKSFVAMAILKLRDEKKLRLEDAVHLYIPQFKNQKLTLDSPDITIRDLLLHAAGLPTDDGWADRELNKTQGDLITFLKSGISFSNVPGTIFEYSNLGYTLLGSIIQRVSGISFQEYITQHIWQPLGMKQASWEFTEIHPDQLAHGYRWMDDGWTEEKMLSDGIFGAMGGMITSIESFSQWVALHQAAWPARDEIELNWIKRSSIREMHQPWRFCELNSDYSDSFGRKRILAIAYGYGLAWLQDFDKKIFVGHAGGLPGFGSHWVFMPDYGIGLMLFTNVTYGVVGEEIHFSILDMLIKEASLNPLYLPPSKLLKDKQKAITELLPDWKAVKMSGLFADNFFLDNSLDKLRKDASACFAQTGKIIQVEDVVAANQLRGSFILKGEKSSLKIAFSLTPHFSPLIEKLKIQVIEDR